MILAEIGLIACANETFAPPALEAQIQGQWRPEFAQLEGGPRGAMFAVSGILCGHSCGHGRSRGHTTRAKLLKTLVGAPRLELGTSCV